MTFRRLAPNTNPAETFEIARLRSLSLYREWLREVPRLINKYPLDITCALGRARVRAEFEKHRGPSDNLPLINTLIIKGTMELIESHNKWKQKSHILRYFDANEWDPVVQLAAQRKKSEIELKASPFLSSFLNKNK